MPELKNEQEESIKCFERILVESYGRSKFEQGMKILATFEQAGGDRYLSKSEVELVKTLQRDVFLNNEETARRFLFESCSYLLIKNC